MYHISMTVALYIHITTQIDQVNILIYCLRDKMDEPIRNRTTSVIQETDFLFFFFFSAWVGKKQ